MNYENIVEIQSVSDKRKNAMPNLKDGDYTQVLMSSSVNDYLANGWKLLHIGSEKGGPIGEGTDAYMAEASHYYLVGRPEGVEWEPQVIDE